MLGVDGPVVVSDGSTGHPSVHRDHRGSVCGDRCSVPGSEPFLEPEAGVGGHGVELVVGDPAEHPRAYGDAGIGQLQVLPAEALASAIELGGGDHDGNLPGIVAGAAQPDRVVGPVEESRNVEHLDDDDALGVDERGQVGQQAALVVHRGQVEEGVEGDQGRTERSRRPGGGKGQRSHVGQDREDGVGSRALAPSGATTDHLDRGVEPDDAQAPVGQGAGQATGPDTEFEDRSAGVTNGDEVGGGLGIGDTVIPAVVHVAEGATVGIAPLQVEVARDPIHHVNGTGAGATLAAMSIRVEMAELPQEVVKRGSGFLLSSVMDSRPHAVLLRWEVAAAEGQVQMRAGAGKTARANCRMRPAVTVLFPSDDPEGYSLIVDGEARIDDEDEHVIITVVGAVLHRPAP